MTLPSTATPRLYYLDWLRVSAMIGIFFFHNARFYDAFSDWHVRNATTNTGATVFVGFLSIFIMPIFFLIAGAGVFLALRLRNSGQFVAERSTRLLIPLIFGMLAIVVPQAYYEAVHHGVPLGQYNLFQVYLLYLNSLPELNWFHLWFLAYLFVFSLVMLPIFVRWTKSGKSVITRLASVSANPWVLLPLLILPLALAETFSNPGGFWGNRGQGGWSIGAYVLFFIAGYLIFANPRIMETVKKLGWVMLAIGVVAGIATLVFFFPQLTDLPAHFGSGAYAIAQLLHAITAWGWLLAILGLGYRFLNRSGKVLSYANEAVLPFYILHQTVIIVIGFYVVQWNTGVGLKYLVISTASFVTIMLIYEFLVRRLNVFRFLFGMRLNRPGEKAKAVLAKE